MSDKTEAIVVAETGTLMPEGREYWVDDSMLPLDKDGLPSPNFSVAEASKMFFGNGPDWLRWRIRPDAKHGKPDGYFILDGKPMQFKRTNAGARYFTLADIERMAHALTQQQVIDASRANRIVQMVHLSAELHGVPL